MSDMSLKIRLQILAKTSIEVIFKDILYVCRSDVLQTCNSTRSCFSVSTNEALPRQLVPVTLDPHHSALRYSSDQ